MGGASFNPTGNASFYAAGLGSDTLFSMALRFPAQIHKGFYEQHKDETLATWVG
ncbi:aquaporin sip1-2-like protein [Trifolium pratense]|uniref:Aquaporin sip1-2-like protein n=1 Tax=Trifolium pratense TaxID=57577 RepID=A0A2K3PI95_TRIPR|nr:aquaporin sip1-2-like protein [Trifolium pratense]